MKQFPKFKPILLIPAFILLYVIFQFYYFYDTPQNPLKETWTKTEAIVVRLDDANDLDDGANGRIFFRHKIAIVKYKGANGDSLEGTLFEYDRHLDIFLHPIGSKISIQYNNKGAVKSNWYAVFFKYLIIIGAILLVLFLAYLKYKKNRKLK